MSKQQESDFEPATGEVIDQGTLTPSALDVLQRAEIDVQISTAKRYPRSMEMFKKRATEMACLDIETAESCIYRRPVGKDNNGKQKIAEGMSIRMAEIVAASYGNIRSGSRIIEQTDRFVKCQGVCHDLETNNSSSSEVIESTVDKNGRPYSERMRVVAAKACSAKAHRDAIFKVVPRALAKPIEMAARKVIAGDEKSLEERRAGAKKWVESLRIEPSRVFATLGVQGWADVTADHLVELTGLRTAIKDNETTVDEAFPGLQAEQEEVKPGAGKFPTAKQEAPKSVNPAPEASNKGEASTPARSTESSAAQPQEDAAQETRKPVAPQTTTVNDKAEDKPKSGIPTRDDMIELAINEWASKRKGERTPEQCRAGLVKYLEVVENTNLADVTSEVMNKVVAKIKKGTLKLTAYDG